MSEAVRCHVVCGGTYHDFDFARLRLLTTLGRHTAARTTVAQHYGDTELVRRAQFLVSYTCDARPSPEEVQAIEAFLAAGGRWLALHASNVVVVITGGILASPVLSEPFTQAIGSRFGAHPAVAPLEIRPTGEEHPIVAGIGPFTVDDELFLMDVHPGARPLLETAFHGVVAGFERGDWTGGDGRRTVMYHHRHGGGEVVYLTLGHCHGPHDGHSGPPVELGSWQAPAFLALLDRAIAWGVGAL